MGEILQVRNAYRMEQWRQIIQDCQKSGLSKKAYCQQQGISEKTYYYWLRKLRTAAVEQAAPEIMELEPEDGKQADVRAKGQQYWREKVRQTLRTYPNVFFSPCRGLWMLKKYA